MIRAVIDTNVLVSGLLSPRGNEALILLAIHHGLVRPCFSQDILEEYAAVLARRTFPGRSLPTRPTPNSCTARGLPRRITLVTGNKRDFPDASYGVTRVVNAGELLDRITFEI